MKNTKGLLCNGLSSGSSASGSPDVEGPVAHQNEAMMFSSPGRIVFFVRHLESLIQIYIYIHTTIQNMGSVRLLNISAVFI